MNYTKGEWRVDNNVYGTNQVIVEAVRSDHTKVVARINAHEERLANANLIAAAPDMYEALLYIKGLMEKHIYKDADVIEFGGSKLSIEREIIKVLAKAEAK